MAMTSESVRGFPSVPLLAGRLRTIDPAEQNEIFRLLFEYEAVQLNRGQFGHEVRFAGTDRAALYLEDYGGSLYQHGAMRGDRLGLCLPIVDHDSSWSGQSLGSGIMPICRSGQTLQMMFHPGHTQLVVIVDRQFYAEKLQRSLLGTTANIEATFGHVGQRFLTCDTGRMDRWQQRLSLLLQTTGPALSQQKAVTFEHELLTAFHSLIEGAGLQDFSGASARRLVELATEHVDRAERPSVTVADLCVALGVSRRTLELAFRTVVGLSPLKFLTQRRLTLAYSDLLFASVESAQVTDIALTYGFTELGRFASTYRQAFGELPSATLRRQAGKVRRVLGT